MKWKAKYMRKILKLFMEESGFNFYCFGFYCHVIKVAGD
jgi:hypothetical protein